MFVPVIDTIINPDKEDYKTFNLEDQNVFLFSDTLGAVGSNFIRNDVIETDNSVMPWEEFGSENITRIT